MMTTDKILDKLAKLKAVQEGEARLGNTAAAEAFAGMINAMLIRHELNEADIPLVAENDPIVEVLVDPVTHGIRLSRVRIGWQEALARVVARAHLCKFLVTRGSNYITFVGTKAHATVAEYAFGVLAAAADRMSADARDEWWRTECGGKHLESGNYRSAWLEGFVHRIAERFDEARRTEVAAAASTSTALVRLEGALVRADAYVKDRYKGKKVSSASLTGGNRDGHLAGRRAADRMALGRKGLEADARPSKRLKG